jgi:catechol 2,3-dioxygenase-like lactoylglutathione lyase family enzyme
MVRPSHLGLCVSDLARSMRFYCDGLGFVPAERFELDSDTLAGLAESLEVAAPASMTSQFIRSGGMAIELLHYRTPPASGRPSSSRGALGLTHLAFHVDDLATAVARAVEHGGSVLESTRGSLGVDLVFIADPDGTRVELMQQPER